MIFCSDFFIKKLLDSHHWYIDNTFLRPEGFSQLIIIMYYDNELNKRYPSLYSLINNKSLEGYKYLFAKIINIITIDNTKTLNLFSYSTDFEIALLKALKDLLPKIKGIGCFFHYSKNLYKNIKKFKLKNNKF